MFSAEPTPHYCEIYRVLLQISSQFISPLFVYLHKLEYVVDDGEIIINNVSDGNEWKNYTLPSKYI